MDDPQFWGIIESGGAEALDDPEGQLSAIRERLGKLPPEELIAFHRLFNQKLADSYLWDLWGAAFLINGGCSDDGFAYFRSWLISRGQATYSAALRNPDILAGIVDPERDDYEFEDLWGIAQEVYSERMGEEMPEVDFHWPAEPKGQDWDFQDDEQVLRRLPKLADLYV